MIKKLLNNYTRKTLRTNKKYLMPCSNIEDIYRYYRKKKGISKTDKKTFKKVIDLYNHLLYNKLKEGYNIRVPNGLGYLSIQKRIITSDRYKKLTGKVLWEDGIYVPRVVWNKKGIKVKNRTFYSFTACRTITDSLNHMFKTKEAHKDYPEFIPFTNRSKTQANHTKNIIFNK